MDGQLEARQLTGIYPRQRVLTIFEDVLGRVRVVEYLKFPPILIFRGLE